MPEPFTENLLDNLKKLRHMLNFRNMSQIRNSLDNIIKHVEKVKKEQGMFSPAIIKVSKKMSIIGEIGELVRELDTAEEVYNMIQWEFKKCQHKLSELIKEVKKDE